jgi:cytochrome c-type biogenesis protein CcmH/NrfG
MHEVAQLLTYGLQNARAGLELVKAALEQNPGCSAELWNMLGDCLFELRRMGDARLAFERALAINPDDVRARYNLAFVHVVMREYRKALVRLAEGLALDRHGVYRERLLHKQNEVLALLVQQSHKRYLGQVDRLAGQGTVGSQRGDLNRDQVGTRSFASNCGSSSNLGQRRSTRAIGFRMMRAMNAWQASINSGTLL